MHINLEDPHLVDKIVSEVKSQGVFDQFRRDCMSDVDTKPAYQNLTQRVLTVSGKFLSEQVWTPDTNKIQLREKLRKHISEAGFLDTGVERIVDQVVNPKISTTFQPKIEDIAYKYFGIEKPEQSDETTSSCANGNLPPTDVDLLPTDLEAVSPDSDKATNKSNGKSDINDDEEESPPFELLEGRPPSPDEESNESKLSAISGLTSQDSIKSENDMKSFSLKPTEECQLSQVSSTSHLSIVTSEDEEIEKTAKQQPGNDLSEEAQMPKFFENSKNDDMKPLHFDIKKDEIKFEGTERNSAIHNLSSESSAQIEMNLADTNESEGTSQNSFADFQNSLGSDNDDSEKALKIMTDISQSDSLALPVTEKIEESREALKLCDNSSEEKSQLSNPTSNTECQKDNFSGKESQKENDSYKKRSKYHDSDTKSSSRSSSKDHHHRSSRKDKYRSTSHKSKSDSSSRDEKSSSKEKNGDYKQKRTKEKSDKVDDHFALKQKPRRKSSDSNDDGDNMGDEPKNSTHVPQISNESANNTKPSESSKQEDSGQIINENKSSHSIASQQEQSQLSLKPVILDKFFDNNNVQSVELAITSNCLQINHQNSLQKSSFVERNFDFLGFNPSENEKLETNLKKITEVIVHNDVNIICEDKSIIEVFRNLCSNVTEIKRNTKKVKKQHKTKSNKNHIPKIHRKNISKINYSVNDEEKFPNNKRKRLSGSISPILPYNLINNDQIINNNKHLCLIIDDCVKKSEHINKKIKSLNHEISIVSDFNVNSKENDCIKTSEIVPVDKTKTINDKNVLVKSSQRYSSEDLYKPRPVLGQRSKRRGMNPCDF